MDAGSGFVHTVEATPANVHDVTVAAKLLREDDEVVYGDSAYLGLKKRDEIKHEPQLSAIEYRINCRPGQRPGFPTTPLTGSGTSKTADPLYDAKWSIPTES